MSSNYQMWLTHNGEAEKLRFPVLPEKLTITDGTRNKSVDIVGLGEVVIKQDRPALQIEFSSFFPAAYFPGVQVEKLTPPETLKEKIQAWKYSDKPCHFMVTGTKINLYCTIELFTCMEQGGDVGSIHYTMALKEYQEVTIRQIQIEESTKTASLAADADTRTDNRVTQATHTVVKGDSLYKIARMHLGSGERYMEIYELNRDQISNPSLIYPGQVLVLPAS